jgi:hypothetical protein
MEKQEELPPPLQQLSLQPLSPRPSSSEADEGGYSSSSQYHYHQYSAQESNSPGASRHHSKRASMALRQAERLTKRAALISKKKIWDSNDASIDAAQSAVDQWEAAYNALRGLLVAGVHSARGLYGAAKAGAANLEDGFLLPVRDWILLPAFSGVERVATETVHFLQSDQARHLAESSLQLAKQVPYVGDTVLAPALVISVNVTQKSWEIIQYPIPSRAAVRDSVDHIMTGTKWILRTAGRETYLYAKRMDANITRTLSHTRWKVLGSGPYATLDPRHKREIVDHLCERYFSLDEDMARYELAAHIRAHNRRLYRDLVLTGVLRERGGDLTKDDEWLSTSPSYHTVDSPFLLPTHEDEFGLNNPIALWFVLPYKNGKRPGRDTPWIRFPGPDRRELERHYLQILKSTVENESGSEPPSVKNVSEGSALRPSQASSSSKIFQFDPQLSEDEFFHNISSDDLFVPGGKYPTIAQWYRPDLEKDLLIDEKRQAVSICNACPLCRRIHGQRHSPLLPKRYGELCDDCEGDSNGAYEPRFSTPPLAAIMRPTMWRFHGPGDELRRAVWFLDTKRYGLQPYGDDSAAVLEDAYLFLKWKLGKASSENEMDGSLLTVEVASPDGGEQHLVQFSSLTQATAIQKGLGAAMSLFKRRVYRGASMFPDTDVTLPEQVSEKEQATTKPGESSKEEWVHVPLEEERSFACLSTPPLAIKRSDLLPSDLDEKSEEDTASHLVLIVHGIGEMLRTIAPFGVLPDLASIVDCCASLRKNHMEMQEVHPRLKAQGRVDYIPVEWHEAFAVKSQRQSLPDVGGTMPRRKEQPPNPTVNDITLKTIPQMRGFANDTLMDVLFFMSPEHHDLMVDIVTNELNVVVQNVRELTGFNGTISIMGHSLGSVISWDLLTHQLSKGKSPDAWAADDSPEKLSYSPLHTPFPERDGRSVASVGTTEGGDIAPLQTAGSMYPQLDFDVENAFMLGSPIAVFLLIRNQRDPLSEDFRLSGCPRVFNIFHPFDPVAYRIEPLLDPRNAEAEPRIITRWNGGFRVQYQTKRLWNKFMDAGLRQQQYLIDAVEGRLSRMGLLDYTVDALDDEDDRDSGYSSDSSRPHRVTCGNLNEGGRVDYMLQEKELESANEYVAAFAAHSSYWTEKDLSLFVAQQILHSTIEASIADTIQNVPVSPTSGDSVYGQVKL